AGPDRPLVRPQPLAGGWVEAVGRLRVPDDELALAAQGGDHRRAVADVAVDDLEGAPALLAGVGVEGDDGRLLADAADELVAVEQRRGTEAPDLHVGVIVLDEIPRPEQLAVVGVEAAQVAHGAEGVDLAVADDGRGPGAAGVGHGVLGGVLMLPEDAA